jgi:hypothetical protein
MTLMVNASTQKKRFPGQNMVKVVPCTLKVGNRMEEMNKNKVQLMDGVVIRGLIAVAQVATTQEVGLMTMKIHMMQRMTGKQPLMHCTYRVPIQIKFSIVN